MRRKNPITGEINTPKKTPSKTSTSKTSPSNSSQKHSEKKSSPKASTPKRFAFVQEPSSSSSSEEYRDIKYKKLTKHGNNIIGEEYSAPINRNEVYSRHSLKQQKLSNDDRNNERIFNDRENERTHEYKLARINNIHDLTNAQLQLNQQRFDLDRQRRDMLTTPVVSNSSIKEQSIQNYIHEVALPVFGYDIENEDPHRIFISEQSYENIRRNSYQYSVLFAGVQSIRFHEDHISIRFINNQAVPRRINHKRGWLIQTYYSKYEPSIVILRYYNCDFEEDRRLCPIQCNID